MFRSVNVKGRGSYAQTKLKEFIRTKVIKPSSILNPAEKLKLYHKENKGLFGPLLDKKIPNKSRTSKTVKNSKTSHQNNETTVSSGNTQKFSASGNVLQRLCHLTPVVILKIRMWQKSKACFNYAAVLLNNNTVRGIKTIAVSNSARSSPAEPGYASEDKILQIKPHQNDFAKQYPSVTLILNKTMTDESRAALEKWKQERIAEMGLEEFNRFYEAQMAVGTKFHSTLKNYFTQPQTQLRIEKDVEGVWVSVADVLKSISSPKAIESNVIHPVLKYRGIIDAIADYEDKPTLIEWKKSDKPRKSIALTYDNPVQLAAYFGAAGKEYSKRKLGSSNYGYKRNE
ncbi:unnamed protein product [Parnassius apollo]|uniref:(apollo) hypothetical protein n=1 Tax=Parnassius apollo TaxID=110799 RepID=A0A8S3WI90_PARAO|nr:unnamed protein product [Parnassius apollo]